MIEGISRDEIRESLPKASATTAGSSPWSGLRVRHQPEKDYHDVFYVTHSGMECDGLIVSHPAPPKPVTDDAQSLLAMM